MISRILIAAIISVESGGNDAAVGAHGEMGPLQITTRCLDDVNSIQHLVYYTPDACFDRKRSIEIFETYIEHYLHDDLYGPDPVWRKIALSWHYGPHRSPLADSDHYWAKVQRELVKDK